MEGRNRLDQRHHITLVDTVYREQLARINGEIIPSYVSWAMRNQMYRRYQTLAHQRAIGTEDHAEKARFAAYAVKFEKAADYLEGAWRRNLDMSIADAGQGRKEMIGAIQGEQGRIQPSEHAAAQPSVVVNNANAVRPMPKSKPSILAALRPKP